MPRRSHPTPSGPSRPRRRPARIEVVLAWIAAIGGIITGAAGVWLALETHLAGNRDAEKARLETEVALVRYCDVAPKVEFQTGDDVFKLFAQGKEPDYISNVERSAMQRDLSGAASLFLRCRFTNYSRIPLLSVKFDLVVASNPGGGDRTLTSEIIPALAPGGSRNVWIGLNDAGSIIVYMPKRAFYARFPDVRTIVSQDLEPRMGDYWVLTRDKSPQEHFPP